MNSNDDPNVIRPRIRPDRVLDIRDYVLECLKAYEPELVRTCLTCANFYEPHEVCQKFKARPPARVIAYGCKDYFNESELPF